MTQSPSVLVARIAATALLALTSPGFAQQAPPPPPPVQFSVSPAGDDAAPGTADRPFRTIERAQRAVRGANADGNVVVMLASGEYRLDRPLAFAAVDGGQNGFSVTWRAAEGATAVVSGGVRVTGWQIHDAARGIYVARVTPGIDARQLWVDDRLAPRARIAISQAGARFDNEGITPAEPIVAALAALPGQNRIEVEGTAHFTHRYSPVERIVGGKLVMQQPAWANNSWGYDTLTKPLFPKEAHLYLANSLAFLTEPGQWYLDVDAGRLYLRPPVGRTIDSLKVELPRLPYLLSIAGTLDRPVQDLVFSGIRFSYTSWLGPSSSEGYANQQSGAYMTGRTPNFPADPIATCSWGCRAFETRRNDWSQIPAAVQVSAANRVRFDRNVFAHLGQVALGIGNDPNAHAAGLGLATRSVEVTRNVFTDLSGGAILAGGIQRDAHHPPDARLTNRNLLIANNRIRSVAKDYTENSAILSTYVDNAMILHNDISDVPYDGIDIGWGWGLNDVGGNPIYNKAQRGYYDFAPNLIYDTPTVHRHTVVAYNRIHDAKKVYKDGGAIYNLSGSPGTVIAENHVFDIHGNIGLYLDEGSKYITLRDNVVADAGQWLNINVVKGARPLRVTFDNTARGNWHDSPTVGGLWDAYGNNLIVDDHLVKRGGGWPVEAQRVIDAAGIEAKAGEVTYGDVRDDRAGQESKR